MKKRLTCLVESLIGLLIAALIAAMGLHLHNYLNPIVAEFEYSTPDVDSQRVAIPGRPHSIAEYLSDPESIRRVTVFTISTNSLGFRDEELPVQKPPGQLRIACVGECVTLGAGVDDDETYPHLLGERLRKRHRDRDIRVINAGLAKQPQQILDLMEQHVLRLEPDVVVYAPGADTAFFPCHTGGAPFRLWVTEDEYRRYLARYRQQLQRVLDLSRSQGFQLVLFTPTFTSFFFPDGQRWIDEMKAFAAENGIPVLDSGALSVAHEERDGLVLSHEGERQRLLRMRDGQAEILIEARKPQRDRYVANEIYQYLESHRRVRPLTSIDGNHPNAYGHELLAQALEELLEREGVLKRAFQEP